ncbi:MAG: hypothetical protein FP811_10335 [Desulfobacteraceae bacterium]|nr:hypothetical protein [Desulfobacteraceae bacterium]
MFAVTLLIILSNVNCANGPFSAKKADFDGLIKQKIYVEGIGGSISKDAPLEIRKQEAFVAAFLVGIRDIAEKIAVLEKRPITKWKGGAIFSNLRKKVAGFEVDSQSIIKEFELTEDFIIINFKGQRFIIKNWQLISPPVEFVEFPKWDNPPATISGVQIQDLKWEEDEGEALCTIKLLYHYEATKSEIIKSDTKAIYRPENIEPSSLMYTGLVVDARGLGLRPAMAPRILVQLNSTFKVLYGPEVVFKEGEAGVSYGSFPKEQAVMQGLCGYEKTLKSAYNARSGENPLTVRAIEVKRRRGKSDDVVISREDADRILEAVKNNDFFKECRVVIVVD